MRTVRHLILPNCKRSSLYIRKKAEDHIRQCCSLAEKLLSQADISTDFPFMLKMVIFFFLQSIFHINTQYAYI